MIKHTTVILGLLFVAACSKAPAQSATTTGTASAQPTTAQASSASASGQVAQVPEPAKPVPAQLPDVLATVNGTPIKRAELDTFVKQLESQQGPVPADKRDMVVRGVVDRLVMQQVLLQEVAARKITVPPADVDARIAEFQKRYPTPDAFAKEIAAQGLTLESVKQNVRSDMAISKMIEGEVASKIAVTDQDLKDYYDRNPEQFKQPEAVRASHILIKVDQGATDAQKKEARSKIDDVLRQVKAGSDFGELAKKHSQDGSASQGGDLSYFPKGQMVPAFEQAAWALEVGQVSPVVETQFGFHVIKLTDKRAERAVPLAEVNTRLAEFLKQRKGQEQTAAFIDALKTKSKIDVKF